MLLSKGRKVLPFYLFTFLLLSCGVDSGTFRIEGEFKGFNQGEFYVYSPDGAIRHLDTIAVKNGRFNYQIELDTTALFMLVFPNFSELPVFGGSGVKVEIKGDASHLKEIEVKGSKTNEQMTKFRLKTSQMTPPEVLSEATSFINDNPSSDVSIYLLNKLFIQAVEPDYKQASELAAVILKARPNHIKLERLSKQLEGIGQLKEGNKLPKFSAIDIKGKPISSADLYAKVNVITAWASWNYESVNIQRQLKRLEKEYGNSRLKIVSFCIDANVKECRKTIDRDSVTWNTICDGQIWETKGLMQLGLGRVPDNIITDSQGKIIAHSLSGKELQERIEKILK
jgi:hypothetical protein